MRNVVQSEYAKILLQDGEAADIILWDGEPNNSNFKVIMKTYIQTGRMDNFKLEGKTVRTTKNGKLIWSGEYLHNVYHGEFVDMQKDGSKEIEHYKHGKLHGIREQYTPSGMVSYRASYINGQLDGIEEKYKYGKCIYKATWKKGKKISEEFPTVQKKSN